MKGTTVTLEGYGTWEVGKEILDVKVVLGSQEKSSSCSVLLADYEGRIADALIKHSVETGGIKELPGTTSTTSTTSRISNLGIASTSGGNWDNTVLDIIREATKQGVKDKGQIAYMLATADGESGKGQNMVELWDGRGLQATYDGRLGNNQPGDGKRYRGRGYAQMTGKERYQYWSKILGVDLVANPDYLAKPEVAIPVLVRGMVRGEFTGRRIGDHVNGVKRDWYNARRVINGIVPSQVSKYLALAQEYYSKIDELVLKATGTTPVATSPVDNKTTPTHSGANLDSTSTYKGRKLTVNIDDSTYTYYHVGTKHDDNGRTEVLGQGVRWQLSRRRRNQSYKGTSLKKLAQQVAVAHKVSLDWQPTVDYEYQHVNQTGISDYQLLLRECKQVGLVLTETNLTLTIKGLKELNQTSLVLSPGVNLISYSITDTAIDLKKVDESGVAGQDNRKVSLDPLTGQLKVDGKDLDNSNKPDVTGRSSTKVSGTLVSGQEAKANQEASKYKRVKALPSTFVLPMDTASLKLQPLDTLRTVNISPTLNRIWLVETVTHDVGKGTTEIQVTSAITTLDTTPDTSQITSGASLPNSTGSYIIPCNGTVTSLQGYRTHPITGGRKMHAGVDIAAPTGTQIVASDSGVVSYSGWMSGYGYIVIIKHSNGETTRYAHASELKVRVGQQVRQGELIALMGSTGGSTGSHSHFEIRGADGSIKNPASYIPKLGKVGTSVLMGTK